MVDRQFRRRRSPMMAVAFALALALVFPAASLGTSRFPNPSDAYVGPVDPSARIVRSQALPALNSSRLA